MLADPRNDLLVEARAEGPLAISVVSIAELVGGMRSAERHKAWRLRTSLRTEPVTEIVAHRAGDLWRQSRRSHSGIGLGDYVIAATVDVRGLQLATLNIRHFPTFTDLRRPFAL